VKFRLPRFRKPAIRSWSRKRKILSSIAAVVAAVVLYTGISLSVYVANHSADPFDQNVATWARGHGLGFVVNRLERWRYSKPPSEKPADALALEADAVDSVPATSAPPPTEPSTTAAGVTAPSTTQAPTTTLPPAPTALTPQLSPALKGEGQWRSISELGGKTVIWATSIRPLAEYGSVVATAAVFDPSTLSAGLFNGPDIPGKGGWFNANKVTKQALPSLMATFNGGFRLEHFKGGYISEGRVIRKMRKDEATIGIRSDGTLAVGSWLRELPDDGSWKSLRQNLPPVVLDGKPSIDLFPGTYWGDDFHQVTFTYRSAICRLPNGWLMYVAMGKVDINLLADALVNMGCQMAMQLDINGNWPQFATFKGFGTAERKPVLLDKRMGNPARTLRGSPKDFIGLFDPATLPPDLIK
jgi:hypothetical protein